MHFFALGCARLGKMIELHASTIHKRRLDKALVKISTSLASVDRIFKCIIDGELFQIKVEVVSCMENELSLHTLEETESKLESLYDGDWSESESVLAVMEGRSAAKEEGVNSVIGGGGTSLFMKGGRAADGDASRTSITTNLYAMGSSLTRREGPEAEGQMVFILGNGSRKLVDFGLGPSLGAGKDGLGKENSSGGLSVSHQSGLGSLIKNDGQTLQEGDKLVKT